MTEVKGAYLRHFLVGFLCWAGCAAAAVSEGPARVLDLEKSEASIGFLAVGRPSMIQIQGKSKSNGESGWVKGSLRLEGKRLSGVAEVPMEHFETGIGLRDRHMREKYLETEKFPTARFELTQMVLPGGDAKAEGVPFQGKLTVHGVEQPVEGTASVVHSAGKAQLAFSFRTRIPNHGIGVPSFMGVTVADEVNVNVEVQGPLL